MCGGYLFVLADIPGILHVSILDAGRAAIPQLWEFDQGGALAKPCCVVNLGDNGQNM